ncbi:hypothetical protein DRQ05_04165, partial [bacterium]
MEGTLEKLGLSEGEVNVYSIIVQFGPRTVGQIQTYINKPAEEIKGYLEQLVNRGYIKKLQAKNKEATDYYIPLPPPIKLTEDVSLRLDKELGGVRDAVVSEWNKTMGELRSKLAELNKNINEKTTKHEAEITGQVKTLISHVNGLVESSKKEINQSVNKILEDAETLAVNNKNTISQSITRVTENLENTFENAIHKIGDYHDNFKTKIEETFSEIQDEHKELLQKELEQIKASISDLSEQISKIIEEYNQRSKELKGTVIQKTSTAVETLEEQANNLGLEAIKEAKNSIKKVTETFLGEINDYKSKTIKTLNEINDELKKLEEETAEKIKVTIQKSKETAINVLKENEKTFVDLLSSIKEFSVEKLASIIRNTNEETLKLKDTLKEKLDTYLNSFKENSQNLLSLLGDGIDDGFQQFQEGLAQSITNLNEQTKLLNKDLAEFIEININTLLSDLDKTSASITKNLEEAKTNYEALSTSKKESLGNKINELKTTTSIAIQESVQSGINSINSTVKAIEKRADEQITSINKTNEKHLVEVRTAIEEKKKEIIDYINTISNEFNEEASTAKTTVNQLITSYNNSVEERLNAFSASHNAFKEAVTAKLNELKDTVTTQIGEKIQESIQEIKNLLAQKEQNFIEKLTEKEEQVKDKGGELRDEVPTIIDTTSETANGYFEDIKNKLDATFKQLKEICTTFENADAKKLQKAFGKEEGLILLEQINNMQDQLPSLHVQTLEQLEQSRTFVTNSLSELSEQVFKELKAKVDNYLATTDTIKRETTEYFAELNKITESKLMGVSISMQGLVKETYNQYSTEFNTLQEEKATPLKEIIGSEKETIAEAMNKVSEIVETFVSKVKTLQNEPKLNEIVENYVTVMEELAAEFLKAVTNTIDTHTKKIKEAEKAITDYLNQTKAESGVKIEEGFDELNALNNELQDIAINTLAAVIEKATEKQNDLVEKNKTKTNEKIKDINEKLTVKVNEGIESLEES